MSDLENSPPVGSDTLLTEKTGFDNGKLQAALSQNLNTGRSTKKKLISLGILLLILAGGIYGYFQWSVKDGDSNYALVTVSRGNISDSIEATGTLSAVKQSAMGFKNDDTITAINVQAGDKVKAGQILAQQDPISLKAALQQALSSVEQDQINVQSTALSLETNRKTLERQQKLFAAGAVAQSDLDTAQNNYKKSEWDLATAKSKLTIDQTKVDQAQADLSAATLIAPFDGIIGAVNGQVGQINGINSSTSTLLTIMSTDLELTALINEADIGRVKIGQDVEFTSSAFSDIKFGGKVLRITPQASTVSNVQYYPVLISCLDPERKLLSGMSVTANIIIAQKKDVLTVPMMAVSYAKTFLKNNPSAVQGNFNTEKSGSMTNRQISSQGMRTAGRNSLGSMSNSRNDQQSAVGKNRSDIATSTNKLAFVVVMKKDKPVLKRVVLGLNNGSLYEVISGLSEGEQVVAGDNQASTQSESSGSNNSSNSSRYGRNRQGGPGMGGPPGM